MSPKNPDNRDNILDTAGRLFAQNGFDATTMNNLAKEASVNKALIYYYFEDKDDINGGRRIDKKIAAEIDFLEDNKNTLSLLLMESLKSGREPNPLITLATREIKKELEHRGFPAEPKKAKDKAKYMEAIVHEFFTGIVPVLAFVALGDSFAKHLDLEPAKCRKLFLKALQDSHFSSHVEAN